MSSFATSGRVSVEGLPAIESSQVQQASITTNQATDPSAISILALSVAAIILVRKRAHRY